MKNLSLILNGVLAVVIIVIYLVLKSDIKSVSAPVKSKADTSIDFTGSANNIVYINMDTVSVKYNMYTDVVGKLEEKIKTSQAQLESRQRTFQKNLEDYQYKAERGLITRREAQEIEQNLGQEQQSLMTLQNQLQYELAEEQQVAQNRVFHSIKVYLETMEEAENIQFVLADGVGSNIMYANSNYDITNKVVEGLNAEYQKKKEEEK